MSSIDLDQTTVIEVTNPSGVVEVVTVQVPGTPGATGSQGTPGPPNVLTIGSVSSSAPGDSPDASISGSAPNQVLNLTLPQGPAGPQGDSINLTIGTVTTGASGSSAAATLTGTAPNQALNLTIPSGPIGPAGAATTWPVSISPTTNYTLALADAGKAIHMLNPSNATVTVPNNTAVAFPVGTVMKIASIAGGWVSFAGSSGVNLYANNGKLNSAPVLKQLFGEVTLRKTATNDWLLSGDALPSETDRAYVRSFAATDLIANGTGYLGDNTNFSQFTFQPADSPIGGGSFLTAIGDTNTYANDELLPVDLTRKYLLSFQLRQVVAGQSGYCYGGLWPYDSAGISIGPGNYMFQNNTTTTLAAPLAPGATTISLTSAANWNNAATTSIHLRRVIVWDWVDAFGKLWPSQTYSRHLSPTDLYADGSVNTVTNTITLRTGFDPTAWGYPAGTTIPAGTSVSNGSSGGTYMYGTTMQNILAPSVWTQFQSTYVGGQIAMVNGGRTAADASTGFPPGTAFVKFMLLANRANGTSTPVPGSQTAISSVSFSDATYAQNILNQATASATANTLALRDVSGRIAIADPSTSSHAATKNYVDGKTWPVSALTATGTRDATTFLRGDNTWAPASASGVPTTRLITAGTGLTGGGDLSLDRTLAVSYGSTAGTSVQGNDVRVTADQAATQASIRTIGTGALQAAAGNHTHTSAQITDATALGTASTIASRDSSGNSTFNAVFVGAQNVSTNAVTRKDYVDGKTWASSTITDAASAATPSVLIKRDAAGRASVVDPSASTDIATKNYTDTSIATGRRPAINAQVGTTYTLVLTDEQKLVTLNNASAITVTVPTNATVAFPIGSVITLQMLGVGAITIAPAAGVTLQSPSAILTITNQYDTAVLQKVATDTWVVLDTSEASATSSAVNNALIRRDAAGRASVVDPSASTDIATKNYVDGKVSGKITVGTVAPSSPATNDIWIDTN